MKLSPWVIVLAGLVIGANVACQKKAAPKQGSPDAAPAAATTFTPRADSVIAPAQIKSWIACNVLLDSLTYLYADSFKTGDPGARLRYQTDFTKAQDLLCVRAGLTGGYEEYSWIRSVMGAAKNKGLLDSLGVQIY